jgi:ATP-dependent Clp protease ATP-binding subunit ClpA
MFEQFTAEARTVIPTAVEEARLRGDRRVGTEHLLLGALRASTPAESGALGVDTTAVRGALADLDRAALAAVGLDDRGVERPPVPVSRKHTPLTSGARAVIARSLAEARRAGSRRIAARHLLLAVLDGEQPDPAADALAHLGVDRTAAARRIRETAA